MGVILCVPSEQEAFAQFLIGYNRRGHDTYLTLDHIYGKTIKHFVDHNMLIMFHELQINPVKTVAMVTSPTFSEVRSLKVTW